MKARRSIILGGVLAGAAMALAGPAMAVEPVTVRVKAPTTVGLNQGFGLELQVLGDGVAGLQATVTVNGKAAEIGGIAPSSGARSLDPVAVAGGARVGVYGATRRTAGTLAQVAVFPRAAGRVVLRVGGVEAVDSSGHRVPVRVVGSSVTVQVGKGTRRFAAAAPAAAPAPSRHAVDADVDGVAGVSATDVQEALYGWQAGDGSGDADRNGRTDVADVQAVVARVQPAARGNASKAASPMTFVVTTTDDAVDALPGDKICRTAAGTCTLRAAIDEANRNNAPDTVAFAIPGDAPQTIKLTLGKLVINQAGTTIDGYTQPGSHPNTDPVVSNALPGIQVDGNGDGAKESVYITNSGTTIRGMSFTHLWKGVWLSGVKATGTTIEGTFIGVTPQGASAGYSGVAGVLLDAGANRNAIGLPTVAGRNVIAGVSEGLDLYSSGTDLNLFRNNLIGTSPDGQQAYGIGDNGADHNFGPKNNVIGGFGALDRNVFAAGGNQGVEYSHGWNQASAPGQDTSLPYQINDNQLLNNYIGFKPDGSYDPSFANGHCFPGCESNDNGQGLNIIDGANRTIVDGNWITGLRSGIQVNADWSRGNVIKNNHIGVAPNGDAGVINRYGIWLHWNTKGNQILDNDIQNAARGGIALDTPSTYDNTLSRNAFKSVGYPAIDMYPLGQVNVNGTQPGGADRAVLYPVIASATTTTVKGTAPKGAKVELYTSWNDPGLYGPGRTYLTAVTANATTGAWTATVALAPGDIVTATSTVGANTSEFGFNVAVPGAPPAVHGVTLSSWEGFGGNTMGDIPLGTAATTVSRVESFEAPADRGDNLGTRLQAILTAPTSGEYTFWIASDDNGRLMLSPSEDPAGRKIIARVNDWTPSRAFDVYASQKSQAVTLVAGQRYYVEAFAKEGGGGDNLAVAWSGPGIARQVIPADVLSATTTGPAGWSPNAPSASVAPVNALLQSFTGQCLDIWGASQDDGAQSTQYPCHGNANQRWTLAADGGLQVYSPAKCLVPAGGAATAGAAAVIGTCTGGPEQAWTFTPGGQLTLGGLCLEVRDGSTDVGAIAQLDTCDGSAEQTWAFAQ